MFFEEALSIKDRSNCVARVANIAIRRPGIIIPDFDLCSMRPTDVRRWSTSTGNQTTNYTYGITSSSGVYRNDLVGYVDYPDSVSGSDCVSYTAQPKGSGAIPFGPPIVTACDVAQEGRGSAAGADHETSID